MSGQYASIATGSNPVIYSKTSNKMKLKIPPFHEGQRVVTVVNHSDGIVRKGQTYTVLQIVKSPCGCGWNVNVGIPVNFDIYTEYQQCSDCKKVYYVGKIQFLSSELFAPIIEDFQRVTFEKIVENEPVGVN